MCWHETNQRDYPLALSSEIAPSTTTWRHFHHTQQNWECVWIPNIYIYFFWSLFQNWQIHLLLLPFPRRDLHCRQLWSLYQCPKPGIYRPHVAFIASRLLHPPQYHLWLYAVLGFPQSRDHIALRAREVAERRRTSSLISVLWCPPQVSGTNEVVVPGSLDSQLRTISTHAGGVASGAQKFPLLILGQSKYLSPAKYWEVLLPDDRRSRRVLSHQAIGLVKIISRDNVLHTIYDNKMA